MYRSTFGGDKYCVRYDGAETKVDVRGTLTLPELEHLIETLHDARDLRVTFEAETAATPSESDATRATTQQASEDQVKK